MYIPLHLQSNKVNWYLEHVVISEHLIKSNISDAHIVVTNDHGFVLEEIRDRSNIAAHKVTTQY